MPFTTDTAHKIINKILRNTDFAQATSLFLSVHTADPGESGTSEFTGYDGDRKGITFDAPTAKKSVNSAQILFENFASQQTITHVGLWSAASAGTFWWGGALTASKVVPATETLRFAAAAVEAEIDPA